MSLLTLVQKENLDYHYVIGTRARKYLQERLLGDIKIDSAGLIPENHFLLTGNDPNVPITASVAP